MPRSTIESKLRNICDDDVVESEWFGFWCFFTHPTLQSYRYSVRKHLTVKGLHVTIDVYFLGTVLCSLIRHPGEEDLWITDLGSGELERDRRLRKECQMLLDKIQIQYDAYLDSDEIIPDDVRIEVESSVKSSS